MVELLVNDKEIVVPGQVIVRGMEYLPSQGTYRLKDEIIANRLGILQIEGKVIRTIPLSGRYIPQRNDVIIGKVVDILMSGWRFDINSPYSAVLPLKDASFDYIAKGADLTKYFSLEDYALIKITNVTSQNLIDVTVKGPQLKKLRGGRIIYVNPQKIPRIIGKKGTMVTMIRNATDCKIVAGQNGLVWLEGQPEMEIMATAAIEKIEQESHISGLTENIRSFLQEKTGKTVEIPPEPADEENAYAEHSESQGESEHGEEGERSGGDYHSDRPRREPRPYGHGGRDRGDRGHGRPRRHYNYQ